MNKDLEQEAMKKNSLVNLDKLLEDYIQIEKTFTKLNGKNKILEIQLEKSNRFWKLSQSKEMCLKEDLAALQNVRQRLQETVELQCNLRTENISLKKNISILEEKLQEMTQNHKKNIDFIMAELKTKEEDYKKQTQKMEQNMNEKCLLKEQETNSLLSKKDEEIEELRRQLRNKEKEKQSEIIKQQIEYNAKLAKIQNNPTKPYGNTTTLSQNIYRMKLQHLQEEKDKELEVLRNRIKELEGQLGTEQDPRLKRRRFDGRQVAGRRNLV